MGIDQENRRLGPHHRLHSSHAPERSSETGLVGNDPDTGDVDAAKSRHVYVQQASHADASKAASDHALDTAKGLHQEANRHRRKLRVKITKQRCQSIARQHTVDRERHFRLKFIEESPDARTYCRRPDGRQGPSDTRKQAIDLQAAILSACASAMAEWWLARALPRDGSLRLRALTELRVTPLLRV